MTASSRTELEKIEDSALAPFAARSSRTRGRKYPEDAHPYRTEFQRDRDRIIHSRAFRRLEYKTQVFVNHEGDHYRTRLTHTIEVAQISRSIARVLRLNEDLAESIALAHDLGHTPFGHAGERELNRLLSDCGGFEHNRQSLRVVESLEAPYDNYTGLNLTWETREGIIKHSSPYDNPDYSEYMPGLMPSLEAQIIDLADEIAYNNHDLDDGLTSGLLDRNEVKELEIWKMAEIAASSGCKKPSSGSRTIIRGIINILATDCIETTAKRISEKKIDSYDAVIHSGEKIIGLSDEIKSANADLKSFLNEKLYRHSRVLRMTIKAEMVVRNLFEIFINHPGTLPCDYFKRINGFNTQEIVTDYIAGMTDRYAIEEHSDLTDPKSRA